MREKIFIACFHSTALFKRSSRLTLFGKKEKEEEEEEELPGPQRVARKVSVSVGFVAPDQVETIIEMMIEADEQICIEYDEAA